MISIDKSLLFQVVNFLFLLWILNLILYRPIRRILAERRERVGRFVSDIKELGRQIDEEKDRIGQAIRQARGEGFEKKETLKKEGLKEEQRILAETHAQVEAKIGEIKERIVSEITEARRTLQSQIEGFARDVASKIVGRQIG